MSQKKYSLAWIFAARHGLSAKQTEIETLLEPSVVEQMKREIAQLASLAPPRLLFPPLPVALSKGCQAWPLRKVPDTPGALAVSGAFKELLAQAPVGIQASDLARNLAVDKSEPLLVRHLYVCRHSNCQCFIPILFADGMCAKKSPSTGIDAPAEVPIDMRAWADGDEDDDWFGVSFFQSRIASYLCTPSL